MKPLALIALLLTPLLADEEKEPSLSRLTFSDTSTISGSILSVDGEAKTLQFTSPFLKGENTFQTNRLLDLRFNHKNDPPEASHYALVTVMPRYDERAQADTIRGTLKSVDKDFITLETWYAGELKLKRSMIKGLNIYRSSPKLYHGPNGLDGWVTSSGKITENWAFANNALISKSNRTIGRKIETEERVKLSFQVAWKSNPYFRISFLANSAKSNYPRVGYTLHVQRSYLQLYRSAKNQRNQDIFSENTRALREQETAQFDIYIDKKQKGKNGLYIDGKQAATWEGTDDLKEMGDYLLFGPQSNNAIRVSNISVAQWDGQLPNLPTEKPEDKKAADDLFAGMEGQQIDLANGDSLIGTISGIEEEVAKIKTSLGDMEIPVAVLRSFKVDSEQNEQPRMWGKDIRAWFTEGGSVTLRLDSLDTKKIHGFSQVFGQAEFDLTAFSRIDFNIWDEELEGDRSGGSTDW